MRYTIGIDFGTESGRAVIVDVATGAELGTAVHVYANGVIDRHLPPPDDAVWLEPGLGAPGSRRLHRHDRRPPSRDSLATTGIDPTDVIGIGVDFTACTMLPTTADGTPLCKLDAFRRSPHAWVKLWKHHAAQPEADRINAVAAARGEDWLPRYGGRTSSEWFYAKSHQILDEAPDVYAAADRLIEAADWIVWRLTGVETRNACTAGYKAIWSTRRRLPRRGVSSRRSIRVSRESSTTRCRATSRRSEGVRVGSPRKRRAGPASGRARLSRWPMSTRTCPSRPSRVTGPARWSRSWAPARATSCSAIG